MFCPNCGKENPDNVRFCAQCGTPLAQPAPQSEVTAEQFTPPVSDGAIPVDTMMLQKRKKLIRSAILGSVSLVAVIAIVIAIFYFTSDKVTVMRAFKNTGKNFSAMFDDNKNFSTFIDNAEDVAGSDECSVNVDFKCSERYGDTINATVQANVEGKSASINGEISSSDGYERNEISFKSYVDENEVAVALPNTLDKSYSVPLDKLGEKLLDSEFGDKIKDSLDDEGIEKMKQLDINPYADTSWNAFKKYDSVNAKAFEDSLVIEDINYTIPHANGDLDVYSVKWDNYVLANVIDSYSKFALTAYLGVDTKYEDNIMMRNLLGVDADDIKDGLDDLKFNVYVGIDGGCVKAVHIENETEYDTNALTLILAGEDNAWERVKVYSDDDLELDAKYAQKDDGFSIIIEVNNDEIEIRCKDNNGELSVLYDDDELITLNFGTEDKGCQLKFDFDEDGSISLDLSISPKSNVEKIKDTVNILDLTEDDIEDIEKDIERAF